MATLNGQTPAQIAAQIVSTPSLHQRINELAHELGVPRQQVEAYVKQQAYRRAYAKRRNELFKTMRSVIRESSSLNDSMNKAVELVEVK
jgi:uncharacterized membrane protein YgaE (UPF0421/DUF939 family)